MIAIIGVPPNVPEVSAKQAIVDAPTQVTVKSTPADEAESTRWQTFEATAYIAMCDEGCTGITRSGYDVRETQYYEGYRVIAVDPDVITLGSVVTVRLDNGYEFEAIALDTGGGIDGREIDVLTADRDSAMQFGRQTVQIKINGEGAD